MMTRKDYVSTAEILADIREDLCSTPDGEATFENLVNDFSAMFLNDNDRFITRRFYAACYGEN
jgi:hypothetical protein